MPSLTARVAKFKYQGLERGGKTYSLSRLAMQLRGNANFASQSPPIWVGGELFFVSRKDLSQGRFSLRGQGLELRIEAADLFVHHQDFAKQSLQQGDCIVLEVLDLHEVSRALDTAGQVCQVGRLRQLSPNMAFGSGVEAGSIPSPQRWARLMLWNSFCAQVGALLESRGLVQVATPSLVVCPGFEPSLVPFGTQFLLEGAQPQEAKELYLPTSPEIHLKKLLCQGWTDIFEIRSCFRNAELTEQHEPEFTMLEWYRAYADLELIVEDLTAILHQLQASNMIVGLGPKDQPLAVQRVSVAELFRDYAQMDLKPTTTLDEMRQKALDLGVISCGAGSQELSWDDIFHLIFLSQIEPKLGLSEPTLVTDYPPSQAALSRINSSGWAQRYEFYWRGFEIANGFDELNDPLEQRLRAQRDIQERLRLGRGLLPMDEEFFQALEGGMPPAGGIALGLERLFMACQRIANIGEIKLFSYQKLSQRPD